MPFCASTTAVLMLVVVLPSRGNALVIRMVLGGAPTEVSNDVRRARYFGHLRLRTRLGDKFHGSLSPGLRSGLASILIRNRFLIPWGISAEREVLRWLLAPARELVRCYQCPPTRKPGRCRLSGPIQRQSRGCEGYSVPPGWREAACDVYLSNIVKRRPAVTPASFNF